ncbi:hypothetical protein Y032_0087g2054 [Ancylostoma ceylanicum]|uniref:G-protein coupled receptors family 1 profile domain-containing protein n=1 Tax=Ancylostoma ceylanicum TaxID=53326 RepID=A0A016TNG0_9BILA|nr:hypothetical protein Y032_0087g2054 [Ancylostoma ceylanicum]
MAFSIALDLLIALVFPVRHRMLRTLPYLILLCAPSWIFALVFTIYGWVTANDEVLKFCNVIIGKQFLFMELL